MSVPVIDLVLNLIFMEPKEPLLPLHIFGPEVSDLPLFIPINDKSVMLGDYESYLHVDKLVSVHQEDQARWNQEGPPDHEPFILCIVCVTKHIEEVCLHVRKRFVENLHVVVLSPHQGLKFNHVADVGHI